MRIPSRAEVDAFCGSPSTRWQRVLGIVSPVLLIGAIVFILIRWPQLPEQIPSHYNFAGEVDGYSGRGMLLLMPILGLVMDAVLVLAGRFPKSWNTGAKITLFNRVRVYRLVRDLMAELRLAGALFFAGFGVYQSLLPEHFSGNILGILTLLFFVPIVRYFVRLGIKG
ncbi:MAG: DUF1648 domain-containing protein [Oscillospiraceae bacterium]|nr:DUF1648 domain-containing protein [Oscillospiraceae bacterium]